MRYENKKLLEDLTVIMKMGHDKGYMMTYSDVFALGYMAGKYGLTQLLDNNGPLTKACEEYDKTDDLGLLDTISETLIDLEIIEK